MQRKLNIIQNNAKKTKNKQGKMKNRICAFRSPHFSGTLVLNAWNTNFLLFFFYFEIDWETQLCWGSFDCVNYVSIDLNVLMLMWRRLHCSAAVNDIYLTRTNFTLSSAIWILYLCWHLLIFIFVYLFLFVATTFSSRFRPWTTVITSKFWNQLRCTQR